MNFAGSLDSSRFVTHMFEEAAANLAEVRLLLVELLLQAFQELPLESVDLFNIAKDGSKLILSEHVCSLTALFDVTLRKKQKQDSYKLFTPVFKTHLHRLQIFLYFG